MWQRLATSELLSTFFPTWLWQGREWAKGSIPRYDSFYWGNAHAHPVLSTYYPLSLSFLSRFSSIDNSFKFMVTNLIAHVLFGFICWYWLFNSFSDPLPSLFGALTITFGSYALKQQPCIIYTLAWFPLTLQQDPMVSVIAVGMMLLAGYYPFAIYLLPIAVMAHILWFQEAWLLLGIIIGLPQIIPFLKYLPKTVKRLNDSCETPSVERRFYVGVIPIILIPFSISRIWPLTLISCAMSLGLFKSFFPRVHERWLIVVQFCVGWQAVNGLNNLHLRIVPLGLLLAIHVFDIYWHNRSCIPPRPWCELYHKPSWAFNNKLTRFLDDNLGDYRVAGLPYPLFTGLVNGHKTLGYQGSMQLKLMAKWRGTTGSHGIDGLKQDDIDRFRIKYSFSRKKPDLWIPTECRFLWRNPHIS